MVAGRPRRPAAGRPPGAAPAVHAVPVRGVADRGNGADRPAAPRRLAACGMARLHPVLAPRELPARGHHRPGDGPPQRVRRADGQGRQPPERPLVSRHAAGPRARAGDSGDRRRPAAPARLRRHRGATRRAGREPGLHETSPGGRHPVRRQRHPRPRPGPAREDGGRAATLREGGGRRPGGAPAGGAARSHRALRPAEDRGGAPRLRRSAAEGAGPDPRPRRRPPRRAATLRAHLRRRVPGHRSAAGRDPAAAGVGRSRRARLAQGDARAGQALPGRRPQAVDLSLPARRRRGLPAGDRAARPARRGGHRPLHELPCRTRHPASGQPRVRAADGLGRGRGDRVTPRLRPAGPPPRGRAVAAGRGGAAGPESVRFPGPHDRQGHRGVPSRRRRCIRRLDGARTAGGR